jgi:hypothetical protein
VWGQYAAGASLDDQAARAYFVPGQQEHAGLGWVGSAFPWGGGRLADSWPAAADADAYNRVQTSEVETLLISGALDASTPPQFSTTELLPYLRNGHQIVLPGVGHVNSFFAEQPSAGTHLINAFLTNGLVDDSFYRPQKVSFTPSLRLSTIAKVIAVAATGLALLAVVSLLWMALRVHERGCLGPRASVIVRSVFPSVLGLGGWCLGVLIVLVTLPGLRLDNQKFVALAVGVPIGLGVYLAWVHQDWTAKLKSFGVAAAAVGALVGVWLGVNAIEGVLLTPIATIVGAAAGANLGLIVLDIWREQQGRDPFADTNAKERAGGSLSLLG